MRTTWIALGLLGIALASNAQARQFDYRFGLADGRRISYQLEIEAEHPGEVVVLAEWDGRRHLTLRLDALDGAAPEIRRTGASPLELVAYVDRAPARFRLKIFSLPASGGETAQLTVTVPDEQPAETEPTPNLFAQAIGRTQADPVHSVPRPQIDGMPASLARWVALRSQSGVGRCGWQSAFDTFLMRHHDGYGRGEDLDRSSRKVLGELAEAIRNVEALVASDDPQIAGPVPDDPNRADLWKKIRASRLRELESRLDDLHRVLGRSHAPELADERWPMRLAACLTACERHFDERVVVGEESAVNGEIVEEEWAAILEAAPLLEELTSSR